MAMIASIENLTLTNMTPSGGSQAEAVDVEGTRAIFLNMELDSFQDTSSGAFRRQTGLFPGLL